MRCNNLQILNLLVNCAIIIASSVSSIQTDESIATNGGLRKTQDVSTAMMDVEIKYKWITSGDMVLKIPIERRLDGSEMINEEKFITTDINDLNQPRSKSGQDSFWNLFNQLDSGKRAPIYTRQNEGSKPVLSKFRYAFVPIWWSDEEKTPNKEITPQAIKNVMDYNIEYYDRMSFGKFKFEDALILPQTTISVSRTDPGWGTLEAAANLILSDAQYIKDEDYDGIVICYNLAKGDSPFKGHGGWGNVNSESSVTWMSWNGNYFRNDVARHEFGHNFGHPHHLTNKYEYRVENEGGYKGQEGIVGYDDYDMMSGGNGYDVSDFALASKWFFGWVPDSSIINMQPQGGNSDCPLCVSEGKYKLFPLDGDSTSKIMGIHIPITDVGNTLYSYWLSYRGGNPAKVGLSVHISWFSNIGNGQFGAEYNSLNYDANGGSDTREDSFVLPGTCYHISPSIKMLEIDPLASLSTQPVVCVKELEESESITVEVSFISPLSSIKGPDHLGLQKTNQGNNNDVVIQCGTSVKLDVASKTDRLLHIKNTGENGNLALGLCPSSGSATAYIYDRYPISPIEFSAPAGYGAFKSLSESSCSNSVKYVAVHNEAWVLIKSESSLVADVSCVVDKCQQNQKKENMKCLPCEKSDTNCQKCPGGMEFVISTCILTQTVKPITRSKKWRIFSPEYHTESGWSWDVLDLNFYSNVDCTGSKANNGTPIESSHVDVNGYDPGNAFDPSDGSMWGGRANNGLFWLGMEFESLREVRCVSLLDGVDRGVTELRVQAWESDTNSWQNVKIVKNLQGGLRKNFPLIAAVSPSESPSLLPSFSAVPSSLPSAVPSSLPSPACSDHMDKFLYKGKQKSCNWVNKKNSKRCRKIELGKMCPVTCQKCDCQDYQKSFTIKSKKKKCDWATSKRCNKRNLKETLVYECPETCETCQF